MANGQTAEATLMGVHEKSQHPTFTEELGRRKPGWTGGGSPEKLSNRRYGRVDLGGVVHGRILASMAGLHALWSRPCEHPTDGQGTPGEEEWTLAISNL